MMLSATKEQNLLSSTRNCKRRNRSDRSVRNVNAIPRSFVVAGVATLVLALVAWLWIHPRRLDNIPQVYTGQLQTGDLNEWKPLGGNWKISNGIIENLSPERGSKLMTGSTAWKNYTVTSDVQFVGNNADMGILIRTSAESEGTDTYDGYYVGIRTLDGAMVIGRADYRWSEAPPVPVPGGVHPSVWYRLRVVAYDCDIAASAQNLTTLQMAWAVLEDPSCFESGRTGYRSMNAGGMWRGFSVTSAGWRDYVDIRQHSGPMEHLHIDPGPPWWTPLHVSVLFAVTLTLALATQLFFFRMQQWKVYTIARERERLAHDIHDTMAQSFAGVGYQIQGIRSRVVSEQHLNSRYIADQLGVAYQLVRSCHEDASRTIAMLSSISPIPQNLVGVLADAARKITGGRVEIRAEQAGNPPEPSLRVANALLQIGREAIANAVSHGDPSELKIRFSYERGHFVLMVEDNGKGFEFTPESAGFGILGMQKRALDVDGLLRVFSTPGKGTQVEVSIRFEQEKLIKRFIANMKEMFHASATDSSVR